MFREKLQESGAVKVSFIKHTCVCVCVCVFAPRQPWNSCDSCAIFKLIKSDLCVSSADSVINALDFERSLKIKERSLLQTSCSGYLYKAEGDGAFSRYDKHVSNRDQNILNIQLKQDRHILCYFLRIRTTCTARPGKKKKYYNNNQTLN